MSDQRNLSAIYRISELLYKSASQKLTAEEAVELEAWANADDSNGQLLEEIRDEHNLRTGLHSLYQAEIDEALESVNKRMFPSRAKLFFLLFKKWQYAAVASAIVATTTIVLIRYNRKPDAISTLSTKPYKNDVAPGRNKALLTLSDGSTIILDNVQNGVLSRQGATRVIKVDGGRLAYKSNATPGNLIYNTLTTPRGGQYQVTLPDGSRVWLNASSSLKYPIAFMGKERSVELTGEGYFEVAKNPAMPFKVKVSGLSVDVLGTNFNINAYPDENAIKTSLLTGSVKVTLGTENLLLQPRDQAQVDLSGKFKVFNDVNVENEVAWMKGYFFFDRADTRTVMRQLARWYDVEVEYQGSIPDSRRFEGKIQRNLKLSQVLDVLASNQVHFRIDGKKLTVLP